MILEERLKKDPEEFLYIGSEYGGGFFFIGKAKDALEAIKEYGDNTRELAHIEDMIDQEVFAMRKAKSQEDHDKHLERFEKLAERFEKIKANNTPFIQREVIDEYSRKFYPPFGQIVIVKGTLR